MVITHLILNGMLKLKSEICDVALLLQDEELRIRNLVKLFFHELHKKDPNIIYNLLPEAISRMSKESANIREETFQEFVKNIQMYLDKDKNLMNLVDKLCSRMKSMKSKIFSKLRLTSNLD